MIKSDIGKNIKKYRTLCGLSQSEIAEKMKMTRQGISSWETGRTEPSINDIERLASILDCSKTDLIGNYSEAVDLDAYMENPYLRQFILYAGAHQPQNNTEEFYAALRAMYDALLTLKK